MPKFILSVGILVIIFIFTAVNAFIICNICDEILEFIDAGETKKANELWESRRNYISLFVRDAEIDVVTAEMKKTEQKIPFEDAEAENDIINLKDAVLEIRRSEGLSFFTLF